MPATGSALPFQGQQNPIWHTSGRTGYGTLVLRGGPHCFMRGTPSKVAHKREHWLQYPYRLRNGPKVGGLGVGPLGCGASPIRQHGVQNQKWPTSRRIGYITSTVLGVLNVSQLGDTIICGPPMGGCATKPTTAARPPTLKGGRQNYKSPTSGRIGCVKQAVGRGWHCLKAGNGMRSGPPVGGLAT